MLFTQLFAVACVLFPVAESLTKGKYCGLQQVAFRTPALFGEYKFVGKGPTTFEYNSGYTDMELEQTFPGDFGGGYVLDMAYFWSEYSRMLFSFTVGFVYYPGVGMFSSYFDKATQTSEFKRLTRA
ncbi:hypothetical protein FOZ60_001181 [Perkinsus olseni]|uniref:Uncharacterized protein n=1 Tax=Perkinsus olseni TaxID=32597 RepID=A0A7J6P0T7_PEROL|nr:hypothetical protein FOZ60_001181 [Perkinsus olseni]